MLVEDVGDYNPLSDRACDAVIKKICKTLDSTIGFATGGAQKGLYERLSEAHRDGGLDFSKRTTFNLDEYVGLPPEDDQNHRDYISSALVNHVNVTESQIHIPRGMADDIDAHSRGYARCIEEAGGIGLQSLGIGAKGHIAFNEPGTSLGARMRINSRTSKTVEDNARYFGDPDMVPEYAINMGVGTVTEAEEVLLIATGQPKGEAMTKTLEGPLTAVVLASMVQMHHFAHVIIDEPLRSMLDYEHHHGIGEPNDDGESRPLNW